MKKIIKFIRHSITFTFISFWLCFYGLQLFGIYYYRKVDKFEMTNEPLFYIWAGLVFILYLYVGVRQFGKFFEIGNRSSRKIEIILISLGWLLIYCLLVLGLFSFQGAVLPKFL
ncbi:MAG: hypothetical protein PHE89_02945 [Alphaproteobacteria bacterium]|nr:hypothetical protein [Alphaproteobacteria bacterium]